MKNILITGCAGFIGFHLTNSLLKKGYHVTGVDSINNYYDPNLKWGRLKQIENHDSVNKDDFQFFQFSLNDQKKLELLFVENRFHTVVHLAAQAGVRYSLENPQAYVDSNINGFFNIIDCCRRYNIKHFIFASSSSVYGLNEKVPFSIEDHTDHPVSLYAATKKSNEIFAHAYSHLYNLPCTGLRFFTVYGPWGRPDMAYFNFTKRIINGEAIEIFNQGNLSRDFTFIEDIVIGIERVIEKIPHGNNSFDKYKPNPSTSTAPYQIYNLGNNAPVKLLDFIECLEQIIGKKARKIFRPMQAGDVYETFADIEKSKHDFAFSPSTRIEEGLKSFVTWYLDYYKK